MNVQPRFPSPLLWKQLQKKKTKIKSNASQKTKSKKLANTLGEKDNLEFAVFEKQVREPQL